MADNPVIQGNWLVSPNIDVEKKWLDIEIQARKSRIARHKQDIEDLLKGKLVDFEAKIMMLEKELAQLVDKRNKLDAPQGVVIQVNEKENSNE